ncbi:regulatory GntR family protein [Ureibacillus xyleni]|uniref:Regulatory GntR family protein n=2 Tax=Ureibacillus xyleni TaxID=614648 RepID=A0A285TPY2_9BACL|nr:regulatory GntR family protein [Ureibacillus xyleni]
MLKRKISRDTVHEHLIQKIYEQEYVPGDRIIETQISKFLSISQGSVREALRELEQAGIVEYIPFKGVFLKKLNEDDLAIMYAIRAEIKGLAMSFPWTT